MLLALLACTQECPTTTDSSVDSADTAGTDSTATTPAAPGTWTKHKIDTASRLNGVYASGDGVYVVANRGQAWVGGADTDWTALELPAELAAVDLNAIWGSGSGDTLELAVVGDAGVVGTYTGGAWTVWSLGTRDNLAVDGESLDDLFVVGDNGIQHFDGQSFSLEASPTTTMNAVATYPSGAVAVGDEGAVYVRSGGNWSQSDTGRVANYYGVAATDDSDVWIVGDQGAVMHGGASDWRDVSVDTKETLRAAFATTSGVVVVGNDGATLVSDRANWSVVDGDTNQNLYGVHGVSEANTWAVGNGGLAMQYTAAE